MNGLVLSGGGARGAYEAGVLYYLYVAGSSALREQVKFEVLSGTSIGALHAGALAAGIHEPATAARQIASLWRTLSVEQLLQLQLRDLFGLSRWLLGRSGRESLFPGGPVARLLEGAVDWGQLQRNLRARRLEAISMSCCQVPTGKTFIFYETADQQRRTFSRDPQSVAQLTRLSATHAQASAAIPFIFPSVLIDGIPYVDGALRQNTPLSPALRLGADRVLLIGLSRSRELPTPRSPREWRRRLASPAFVLSTVLHTLTLEQVDHELLRLEQLNQLLRVDPPLASRLNTHLADHRGARYREIPTLNLRPSKSLGGLAADYLRGQRRRSQPFMRRFLKLLAQLEGGDVADLASYLLFEGDFCDQLINLAIEDTHRRRDELARFFES